MPAGICLTAGSLHAFIAATHFTLAWMHSIEKIRWEEDYVVQGRMLELREARVRGSGAGMDPPAGAILRNGAWHYRPRLPPLPEIELARSRYTSDYELCIRGACSTLGRWIPVAAGTTRLAPCMEAEGGSSSE